MTSCHVLRKSIDELQEMILQLHRNTIGLRMNMKTTKVFNNFIPNNEIRIENEGIKCIRNIQYLYV